VGGQPEAESWLHRAERCAPLCNAHLLYAVKRLCHTGVLNMLSPQRRRTEYRINLSFADYIKVVFDRTGKEVVQFAVQYLASIEGEWQPIVRFDTAHGRPHMDISHPDGSQERQELPFDNYNTALSYAIHHVKTRWQFYRERYERWKHG
jgi:hypothetical protein